MKIFNTDKIQLYKKALDVHARQHEAIAKNVANANDSNYKRVKTDFSEELHVAVSQKLKTSDPRHIQASEINSKNVSSEKEEPVDLNQEMAELAVNQIRFSFVSNVLKKAYGGLNSAILGRLNKRGIYKVEGVLSAIKTTVGGLNRQMQKLEVISDNIANAEKTPDKNGEIYKRKVLVSDTKKVNGQRFSDQLDLKLKATNKDHLQGGSQNNKIKNQKESFEVIEQDSEIMVYEPNHPMADENGYVKKPDVNLVEEMVDLISATRIYEANVTVMNAAKNIAKKSMEI